jgi:tetratricopeptide (TPR) repeat protein/transcriptional regulator with XRE-family HTH domain
MPVAHTPAFGRLLKQFRVAAGLTQEELAERAGLSPKSIGDLETGRRRTPRRDTLALLTEALHLTADERTALEATARRHVSADGAAADIRAFSSPAITQQLRLDSNEPHNARTTAPQHLGVPRGAFLGSVPERVLVGRNLELVAALREVQSVMDGSGRLLVIAGEPGIGKTRLSQEIAGVCRDQGFLVATGRCYEPHLSVPFYPFLEVFTTLHAVTPEPLRSEISIRWPALMHLLPEQTLTTQSAIIISHHEEQQRLFWAMNGYMQALSEILPVALLLDDLHWSDESSIELLQHLTRHTRGHRVLLLGTYRHVELPLHHPLERALRDLNREHLPERILLNQLSREDTTQLIASMLEQDVPEAFAELIHGHTDGNPLFVLEVLRTLIEHNEIDRHDGYWDCSKVTAIAVPESIRALIADRVSRLAEPAQDALRAASVIGQTFTFEHLQATVAWSEETLDSALEQAFESGLVQESHDGYVFNHALTQQTLYVELTRRRRQRLHLAAANALERLPERLRQHRAAEMEWHFREGGSPEQALPYALLAGNYAASMFCGVEAEKHYLTALDLAEILDDRAGEARALEKLGWLMWMQTRLDSCADTLERSAQRYHELADVEGEMRAVAQLGMLHFTSAPLEGVQRVATLLTAVGTRESSRPLAWLYTSLALNLLIAGRYRETVAAAERAAEVATTLNDRRMLVWAEATRGPALGLMGHLAEARHVLEECIPLSESLDDYFSLLSTVHYLGDLSIASGDFTAALDYYHRALELAMRLGAQSRVSAETANLAAAQFYLGDWKRALESATRAATIADAARSGRTASYFQFANVLRRLGTMRATLGNWADGAQFLAESVELAERLPYPEGVRSGQRILAEHDLEQGMAESALARIEPLVSGADSDELGIVRLQPCLAHAFAQLGANSEAERILDAAIERAQRAQHQLALVELLTTRGVVLSRGGSLETSKDVLGDAIALARRLKYPHAEGRALYALGGALNNDLDRTSAVNRLEEALAIFRRLGSPSEIERVKQSIAEIQQT